MVFIDLQINGYAGVDFNGDDHSLDAMHRACEALRADGAEGILATIITAPLPALQNRLARLADWRRRDPLVRALVWGIHLEGPFLNSTPGYAGAHSPSAMRLADGDTMKSLLDAAQGLIRLVTLAPESDPGAKVTRFLTERKILVAAGHCNPTREELLAAIDNGLSLFTHFGNGCPPTLPRHDNVLQRALSLRDRLWFAFIADGVHIPPYVLMNYLDFVGPHRAVVVTDAMAAARLGPGRYTLGARTIEIGADRIARCPEKDSLAGSTATMPQIAGLLRAELGLGELEIERLLYQNPKQLLAGRS
ncbi:MAG: N-acetylglucosamine-6-phosphate deacetylase [Pirellulales bacterium]|nr:N-acetylglucosamine-6-phosphate deacetylase [Pirellulales bacterium]